MSKLDDVATDVQSLILKLASTPKITNLDTTVEFNDHIDELFDTYDDLYHSGDFSRQLTDTEKRSIIDTLTKVYSVTSLDQADLLDNAYNEYLD